MGGWGVVQRAGLQWACGVRGGPLPTTLNSWAQRNAGVTLAAPCLSGNWPDGCGWSPRLAMTTERWGAAHPGSVLTSTGGPADQAEGRLAFPAPHPIPGYSPLLAPRLPMGSRSGASPPCPLCPCGPFLPSGMVLQRSWCAKGPVPLRTMPMAVPTSGAPPVPHPARPGKMGVFADSKTQQSRSPGLTLAGEA